jgi:hypothetical protein
MPDDSDWDLPAVPTDEGLPDNTASWGPFYRWQGEIRPSQSVLSIALTREITPPWRRGVGLVIRWDRPFQHYGYAVGIWKRGKAPRILFMEPEEKNLQIVIERARRLDTLTSHNEYT